MDIEEARRRLAANPPHGDPTAEPGETLDEKAARLHRESHMCVGPTCWICGTPSEINHLRFDLIRVFYELQQANPAADHHALARAATAELRPTLMRWLHAEGFIIRVAELLERAEATGQPLSSAFVRGQLDDFRRATTTVPLGRDLSDGGHDA